MSHQLVDHVFKTRHETAEAAAAEVITAAFGDESVEARIAELALSVCQLGMILAAQAALTKLEAEGHPDPLTGAIEDFHRQQEKQRQSAIRLTRRMMVSRVSV